MLTVVHSFSLVWCNAVLLLWCLLASFYVCCVRQIHTKTHLCRRKMHTRNEYERLEIRLGNKQPAMINERRLFGHCNAASNTFCRYQNCTEQNRFRDVGISDRLYGVWTWCSLLICVFVPAAQSEWMCFRTWSSTTLFFCFIPSFRCYVARTIGRTPEKEGELKFSRAKRAAALHIRFVAWANCSWIRVPTINSRWNRAINSAI